jgi:hypothetical protein
MDLTFLLAFGAVSLLVYVPLTRWIYGTDKIINLLEEIAVNIHDTQLFLRDIRKQNQILIRQQSEIPDIEIPNSSDNSEE